MSRLETTELAILQPRSASRATTRRTEKTTTNAALARSRASQAERGRLTAEEFTNNLQHYQRRLRSRSRQGGRQPQWRAGPLADRPNAPIPAKTTAEDAFSATSDIENEPAEASVSSQGIRPAYALAQSKRLYNPSRTQLLRDADTFQNYRIRSVARDLVDKWCYAAAQAKDQHEHMGRLASARDTEILLRQAFEHWRHRLHAKRQALQREGYFEYIDQRILGARNALILATAFTHWRQYAHYHVVRASRARKHILSVKYFEAWRNITVANQLKALRQGRRKFFNVWKQRYIRCLTDSLKADLVRQASLSRNAYWDWFWAFCERRAPEWRAGRLKRKYFSKLIDANRSNGQRDQLITTQSGNSFAKKAFLQWLEKARLILSAQREAATFSHQKLIARTLPAWRQDTIYSPLARQISNCVDWRVARVTFAIFVATYRLEKQAEHVDRLRITRNQWTRWNDRLRCQKLSHRIDERHLHESLYKWIAACRASIIHRLFEQRLQRHMLYKLRYQWSVRRTQRESARKTVQTARDRSCLRSFLGHWRSQLGSQRQVEQIAIEFYAPKTADTLRLWGQCLAYQRKLDASAKDADFFFVGRKLLKGWHTASIESKKQKRRNAYMQVRRGVKMRLAAGVLQQWRQSSAQICNMQQEAETIDRLQVFRVGTNLFDFWKSKVELRRDQDYQAMEHNDRRLLERCLYTWIERLEDQARMEETADLNNEMHVRNIAFGWFHKLRLRIIEQKGREANAESLSSWYEKRHSHNMLRQWQHKTVKARSQPQETPALSFRVSRARPRPQAEDRDGLISRAEDWTDFDVGGDWMPASEAQSSSTPLPGYLSTPSKRAARAKALVMVSTTPAGTPLEHRLRSQFRPTPRTARRSGFGRSAGAFRNSTFGVIVKESPRTPDMDVS